MAGIYIHIPFCKQICHYCDFYKIGSLTLLNDYISALCNEIILNKNYFNNEVIETIYFGGGTPSVLAVNQIDTILKSIYLQFKVIENAEITFEANPDDINSKYLGEIKEIGINRLSIGIQSFNNSELKIMNRRHNSLQAVECVKNAQKIGFNNISIDLIYGLPNSTFDTWKYSVESALQLDIQHISAYHLTYEPKTVFGLKLNKNEIKPINEDLSILQFKLLRELLNNNNFIAYEISNFGKKNYFSKHNSNYWKAKPYLGLGAAAHSFDLESRRWNISNVKKYIEKSNSNEIIFEIEYLNTNTKFNELIMTSLRTIYGVDLQEIKNKFGDIYLENTMKIAKKYQRSKDVDIQGNILKLTEKGIFISDLIISDFFIL